MTTMRNGLWVVLALSAGCFSPSPQTTNDDAPTGGTSGPPIDAGSGSTSADEPTSTSDSTSGGLDPTSTTPATSGSDDTSSESSSDTSSNPGCPRAVFGGSVFDDSCFQ